MPDNANFFVSYNHRDQSWAEWIAWQLEEAGYAARIQAWDFRPGTNFVLEMHRSLTMADRLVLVLSVNFLTSDFTQAEWSNAFAEDASATRKKVVPVRVAECKPVGLLRTLVYIDLVGKDEISARAALLAGVLETRAKPARAPRFPASSAPFFPASETPTPPAGRTQFTLVLTGTIDEAEKHVVEAIVEHLKKISSDASMTLKRMERGSIRMIFECSEEGFERLKSSFERGDLAEVGGLQVESLADRVVVRGGHITETGVRMSVDAFFARWYSELQRIANRIVGRTTPTSEMDADILVNESYLRMRRFDITDYSKRTFTEMAARVMRHVLVDWSRRQSAMKRGPALVELDEALVTSETSLPLIEVHEALERLERVDPNGAKVVELSYFAGLTTKEVAELMGISAATAEWRRRHALSILRSILQTPDK